MNIGDTRSGSGGAGGDYGKDGLKGGQPKYKGSGKSSGLKPKDMAGIPQSLALALRADGWYRRHEDHMGQGREVSSRITPVAVCRKAQRTSPRIAHRVHSDVCQAAELLL